MAASSSDDARTGTEGAADFDVGYVTIGAGDKVVDVFIDPMCSFCKHFEETSGEGLFSDAAAGVSTVRCTPDNLESPLARHLVFSAGRCVPHGG